MVAPAFEYAAAGSYDEAVRLLAENGEEAKILAGGQSLMPMLNLRLAHPELLIDINPADQRPLTLENEMLRLPALTRHRVLLEHDLVRQHCPLLAEAVRHVGNVRVRNRGTIAGSLAHADPTSEIGCCALATGAQVVVRGPAGNGQSERTVPASELFTGYWSTTLDPAEIITNVLIPVARPRQGWSFQEMVRRTSDFAIVAVGVIFNLAERSGEPASATVALAGVADRVVLADPELLNDDPDESAARIAETLDPPDDVHASGAYRRRLARVLTARALREASARAAV
ncbi:MAG TPA: xanthine dehydrogenase family protein subunit M [Streptosporangiaceae bacterium]|nr:xanthine dehydrogenase family protein subunit M [Streptosporangiaceae bacterium]